MELYSSIAPNETIQQCFQKYLLAGGMPYLANLRYVDAPSEQYLHDLFNSVQLKDTVKRNKIRDVDLLERIIAYVIANVIARGTLLLSRLGLYNVTKTTSLMVNRVLTVNQYAVYKCLGRKCCSPPITVEIFIAIKKGRPACLPSGHRHRKFL